jgi:hypothetical protein
MSVKKQNIQYTTPQQNKKNEKKKASCRLLANPNISKTRQSIHNNKTGSRGILDFSFPLRCGGEDD